MTELDQKWEYRVQTFGTFWNAAKPQEVENALNEWGLEGWKVVCTFVVENTSKVNIIAQRPLALSTRRRSTWPESEA